MEDSSQWFEILPTDGQNLINTFGQVTFIGGVSVEPLAAVGVIEDSLTLVSDRLTEFAASLNFEMDMQTVFGESVDVELGRTIIDSLHLGGRLPEITVVPVEKMNGIDGGFDSLTGGVYLADTLINPNSIIAREPTQSPNLADVLVEEFGHLLDSRLNQADTPGDEGELFAALVRGDVLGGPEILEFKDEDDRAEINLGRTVEVEASSRQKRARVQPSFREAFASQVGEYPTTVAIGEFNRDGVADLAVTHWFSTDVSVLLGNQGGGFAKATNFFGGGHFLEAVALGEFDGDGALDLALTNLADTSMLLGHGDGHFGEAAGFSTAENPKSVAVGEFNGDGFLDAAVVNVNSHNLSVLLGKGDGNFEQPVHFDVGQHPRSIAVGEFNSDDVLDLAVVNDLDVLILLGDGDGGFSKKGYVDPGYEQRSVAVGEFNGDGISDLAVVDSYYDKVSVMLGDGKGDFGRPSYLDLETYDSPWSVAAGEINGDGLHDLAVVYPWSESVSVLLNTTPVEPSMPKVSISNTRITEGNKGTKTAKFTVSLDALSTQRVELDYATANDTARAGKDYKTTKGTLIFNPGEISKTIAVPVVGDKRIESQEQFKLKLSNPTNASFVDEEAIATIRDNDVARVSINNRKIVEGDGGSKEARFKVFLNAKSSKEVEVSYATVDDSAKAGEDYEATEGTLTFKPGQKSKVIKVPVLGDDVDESNERFFVELGDAKNARFKDKRAVGRIADNDTTPDTEDGETEEDNNSSDVPKISISDRPTNESEKEAVFEVYLNTTSTKEVEVSYATADDTAKAGEDYETTKGTLTFEPGKTREEIAVPIIGNSLEEDTENFIVNLSNPKNGELQDERGVGQILDDDAADLEDVPEISISDKLTNESEKEAVFEVYLNTTSTKEVEVSYATADDTAKAGEDYEFTNGTLTFEPGETKEEIVVPIIGNSLEEETEDFAVILSNPKNGELKDKRGVGQILDDDAADLEDVPEISISDRLANEGEKQAVFEVYLDTTSTKEVEVSYATADDTAKAGEDYETIKGTLTFEPGETKEEIVVPIIGNSLEEDTENFIVNLSSPKNGELKKGRGVGQILDDDEPTEIAGSEWNASFYEFTGDKPPTDFYLNDSQKLAVLNLGSSEEGFDRNWGSGSPSSNIPQDKFAVRSYTHADFEEGKVYKARVRADDGYQLLAKHHTLPDNDPNKWVYITSKDEWREDAYGEYQEIEFTVPNSGKYDLHFHYYENTGDAYFDLSWEEKPVDSGSGEDTVTEDRYYSVKEGDTLSGIALNKLGDASRWREIIRESTGKPLTDDEIIRPQDLLILPDGSGSGTDDGNDGSNGSEAGGGENSENVEERYYSVKEGDTPSRIALKELGDASRWREIARDSTGKLLTDGDNIINPEELLILPGRSGRGTDDDTDGSNGSEAGGGENSGPEDSNGGNPDSGDSNSDETEDIGTLGENWSENNNLNETDLSDSYSFKIDKRSNLQVDFTRSDNANAVLDAVLDIAGLEEKIENGETSTSLILEPGDYRIDVKKVDRTIGDVNYNLNLRSVPLVGNVKEEGLTEKLITGPPPSGLTVSVNTDLDDRSGEVNLYAYNSNGRTYQGIEAGKDTIVVIHGNNPEGKSLAEDGDIQSLAQKAAEVYRDHQVLVLDWKDLASNGDELPPKTSARAIRPVANWAQNTLTKIGLTANSISLFGHSLGSYVSAEIGQMFGRVNSIVALDPASADPFGGANTYDLDGNTPGKDGQTAKDFRDVANKSVAFVVSDEKSGFAGDNDQAATANDSFIVRFNEDGDNGEYHSGVVEVFTDILDDKSIDDYQRNWYGNRGGTHTKPKEGRHEGVIDAKLVNGKWIGYRVWVVPGTNKATWL